MEPEPEPPADTLEEQNACRPEAEPEPEAEAEAEPPADDVGVGEAVEALGLDVEGALQRAEAEARRIREAEATSVDASPSPVQARPRARSPLVHVDHVGTITGEAVYDRLTDPQGFTGAHKHRFDATGIGRGLDGRDSIIKGGGNVVGAYMNGAVHDLSQITRSPRDPRSTCSARKRSQGGAASPQIFDRLTDPHLFTGAHKHRFDQHGHGRGLDGRDYVGKGSGTRSRANPGAVHDLSQITRSPLPTEKGKPVRTSGGRSGGSRGRGRGRADGTQRGRRTSASSAEGRKTERRKRGKNDPEIFTKLTDATQYTATHRHRFDPETGKGKGLGGRDSVQKGSGHSTVASYDGGAVHDLSQITRPGFYAVAGSDDPTQKSTPRQVSEGVPPGSGQSDSIFAKLTDPRLFTGAHKARQMTDA